MNPLTTDTNGHRSYSYSNERDSHAATDGYHFDNPTNPTIVSPAPLTVNRQDVLQVKGPNIVKENEPILLRGTCLGGWSELR